MNLCYPCYLKLTTVALDGANISLHNSQGRVVENEKALSWAWDFPPLLSNKPYTDEKKRDCDDCGLNGIHIRNVDISFLLQGFKDGKAQSTLETQFNNYKIPKDYFKDEDEKLIVADEQGDGSFITSESGGIKIGVIPVDIEMSRNNSKGWEED